MKIDASSAGMSSPNPAGETSPRGRIVLGLVLLGSISAISGVYLALNDISVPLSMLALASSLVSYLSIAVVSYRGDTASRSRERDEILERILPWAGTPEEALRWYRAHPIAGFGDRTAESMVKSGQAEAVRDHLDRVALGGYA